MTTARAVAQAGAAVGLADINETAVTDAVEDLTDAGHQALALVCDGHRRRPGRCGRRPHRGDLRLPRHGLQQCGNHAPAACCETAAAALHHERVRYCQ
ncbi:hypothetical protein ACFW6E_36310 [Streptomyces olivaceoviridis]|uniref:hypothetical protein n=1 Tax=Streptomyces olivaceoviridis TaxID=1921 RepID=UPI003683C3F9